MLIELDRAIEELQKGGLVGLPTETVYGLGGVATLEAAMEQIYHVKQRPRDNPLICHFFNTEHVRAYVDDIPAYWSALVAAFSPGPVSYRLPLPASSPLQLCYSTLPHTDTTRAGAFSCLIKQLPGSGVSPLSDPSLPYRDIEEFFIFSLLRVVWQGSDTPLRSCLTYLV